VNPHFTINFRREAYASEVARARRRVFHIAAWIAYLGVLLVLMGLYGLNCNSLARRTGLIERQAMRLRGAGVSQAAAQLRPAELTQVERYIQSPRRWRDRLERLGTLLPQNARLTSLAVNPQNLSDAAAREFLVLSGSIRNPDPDARMQSVMRIVSQLRADSLFGRGYRNIKLASTRVTEDGSAEFVIECR